MLFLSTGASMANDDHLSTEISITAELTESGVKASAKSRTVAAIDRLAGNLVEWGNVVLESGISIRRAKIEGERQLIEAAARYAVERMGSDADFAQRTYENHFRKIAAAQENKDAVVAEALADLRAQPPSEQESNSGPPQVNAEFMNRFETYAEGATSEELRQRWGRVLASEIRTPGTFSQKELRATDELDGDTAKIFERVSVFRVRNLLIKPIMPELPFNEKLALVSAGLIVDPSIGHISYFGEVPDTSGAKLWLFLFGNTSVGFKQNATVSYSEKGPVIHRDGKPAIPVYILTDVGLALSSILPANEPQVGLNYASELRKYLPDGELIRFCSTSARSSPVRCRLRRENIGRSPCHRIRKPACARQPYISTNIQGQVKLS
jgi:hypothetical protein